MTLIIGGKAGAGIKEAGRILAELFLRVGYHVFGYVDYPSLIRGGHNFVTLRISGTPVNSVNYKADIIIATDRRSIQEHLDNSKDDTLWLINEKESKEGAVKVPFKEVAPGFFKSSSIVGAVSKLFGIPRELGLSFVKRLPQSERNESIYDEAYDSLNTRFSLEIREPLDLEILPGNECVALGAVDGGLEFYIAYPMTPASPVLHYLAKHKEKFGITVVQPENEISALNMALGVAYVGRRSMVGTSGGGFALMTETLSLAGMSETPIVIYEAQRAGPSTGVPTYTAQSDLLFVLHAGHGDFPRVVIAPGTPEEAYHLTREAMNIAWRYQVPVIVLGDKHLGESYFSARINRTKEVAQPKLWDGEGSYLRYKLTPDGVSPLAFPGREGVVVKATSYEHDERGITVEDADSVRKMQEKRLRKFMTLKQELLSSSQGCVVEGDRGSNRVLLCWGSVCCTAVDISRELGWKVVRPTFLEPFPTKAILKELEGATEVVVVENSAGGQFERLLSTHGIGVDRRVRKYDGRPFFRDELARMLEEV